MLPDSTVLKVKFSKGKKIKYNKNIRKLSGTTRKLFTCALRVWNVYTYYKAVTM